MKTINAAIQVLPKSKTKNTYDMVDSAIDKIKKSGLKYRVCPFETVVEGYYDDVMKLVKEVQDACYSSGAEEMLMYIKIQTCKNNNVTIEDKMFKYDE
jgi:uncharacterized protein (TIGR00106 family)